MPRRLNRAGVLRAVLCRATRRRPDRAHPPAASFADQLPWLVEGGLSERLVRNRGHSTRTCRVSHWATRQAARPPDETAGIRAGSCIWEGCRRLRSIRAMRAASWQRVPSQVVHFDSSQRADSRNTCETGSGAASSGIRLGGGAGSSRYESGGCSASRRDSRRAAARRRPCPAARSDISMAARRGVATGLTPRSP